MKVKIRKKGNQNTKELKNSLLEKEGKQDKITRDLYPKFTYNLHYFKQRRDLQQNT